MRRRRFALMLAAACLVALVAWGVSRRDSDRDLAVAIYDRIGPNMTRTEVGELLRGVRDTDAVMGNAMDSWTIAGKYRLTVSFGPRHKVAPGAVDDHDPNGER